jgi:hypothetical protein
MEVAKRRRGRRGVEREPDPDTLNSGKTGIILGDRPCLVTDS